MDKKTQTAGTPLVDIAVMGAGNPRRREQACAQLLTACRSHGYFSLINTGISDQLINRVLQWADQFFLLPDDDPRKQAVNVANAPGSFGWSPMFSEPAYTAGTIAHLESFDCGPYRQDIEQLDNPDSLGLYPSCWPDLPGFRATIRQYWDLQQKLGGVLFKSFARALALDGDFFETNCTAAAPSTLRLIHYPENDSPNSLPNVGISEHSDFECFTVIYQTAPGLELLDVNGRWVQAPVEPGRFVVMIGDMLERWTNGFLKATRHRVPNTAWARNSIVMFFAADAQCLVQPLEQYIDANNPARFRPVTQQAHIAREIEQAENNRLALQR